VGVHPKFCAKTRHAPALLACRLLEHFGLCFLCNQLGCLRLVHPKRERSCGAREAKSREASNRIFGKMRAAFLRKLGRDDVGYDRDNPVRF